MSARKKTQTPDASTGRGKVAARVAAEAETIQGKVDDALMDLTCIRHLVEKCLGDTDSNTEAALLTGIQLIVERAERKVTAICYPADAEVA